MWTDPGDMQASETLRTMCSQRSEKIPETMLINDNYVYNIRSQNNEVFYIGRESETLCNVSITTFKNVQLNGATRSEFQTDVSRCDI